MSSRPSGSLASNEPIAIVGIGCRLPGNVTSPSSFWEFLKNKGDAIKEVPANRWNLETFYSPEAGIPGTSTAKCGGFLDDIYGFDPAFFDISPREVENMDPQQFGLLQVVYEALQDAKVTIAEASRAVTGVFVGITMSDYRSLLECDRVIPANDIYAGTGVAQCIAANRISHRFNFTGPSMALDTACSSSMVAVDLAVRNIRDGACDMAIAAGVNVLAAPTAFIIFSNANMLSPTGKLSTFDAAANGFVRGEGFGAVVLKPLCKALADGDDIYGLIRSTVVNQDGHTKTLTAPSQDAQAAMLQKLCEDGGVDPSQIGYVECHGTGTPTGDPIEAGAVGRVFGKGQRGEPLMVGSVKPNVGHLEAAAGITGLIKAALVARHGEVPPNINYSKPNPQIPFAALNLTVPQEVTALPQIEGRQLVVVNSFGFGGTNASALIEAWRPQDAEADGSSALSCMKPVAVPLSAATGDSLRALAANYAAALEDGGSLAGVAPAALARAVCEGRDHFSRRAAFVAANASELTTALRGFASGSADEATITGRAASGNKICFTFSGQGSQWYAMGRELMQSAPVYAGALAEFDALFEPLAGWSVRAALLQDEEVSKVDQSAVTQPTICALQIALAALWARYGVKPDMVIGHSLGEVAAAYVAGAIDLATAVRYIYKRSLIRSQIEREGAMAVVGLSAAELSPLLPQDGSVEIAGYNAPATITISGDSAAVSRFVEALKTERPDLFLRQVKTDTAWHSYHLEAGKSWFYREAGEIAHATPDITFISTVTGEPACWLDTDYWWSNLRQPVRFEQAVQSAMALGATIFLELAPQRTLTGPTGQSAALVGTPAGLINSLDRKRGDLASMAAAIGELYVRGVEIDWTAVAPGDAPKLDLPKYPWANARHTRLPQEAEDYLFKAPCHPLLGRRLGAPGTAWRSLINTRGLRYIADHRLREECLFPAAGYLEIMLAAGIALFGKGPIEIEDIRIYEALFIRQDTTVALQIVYSAERDTLRIYSKNGEDGTDWVLRSEGRVNQRDMDAAASQPAPVARPLELGAEFWYANQGPQSFIQFGPLFQPLQSVAIEIDGYRSVAQLTRHPGLAGGFENYHAHPALLDAALQLTDHNIATLGATKNSSYDAEGRFTGTTHSIPTAIRRVILLAPFVEKMTLEVTHKQRDGRLQGNTGIFRAPDGTPLVIVEDVVTKGIPISTTGADVGGDVKPAVLEESYYPVAVAAEGGAAMAAGRILVLADDMGRIDPLVSELRRGGAEVEVNYRSDAVRQDLAGYRALIERHFAGEAPGCIVFGFNLGAAGLEDRSATDKLFAAAERDVIAFTALGQVLEARRDPETPTAVILLTRQARQVPGDESVTADGIVQAPLVGLARTIAAECDSYPLMQIDLDDEALDNPGLLAGAMFRQNREGELVLRGGKVLAPRIERRTLEDVRPRTKRVAARDARTNFVVTMKAPGVIDALELREVDMPVIGDDDVMLEMKAVGLNFRDIMAVTGLLPAEAEPEPAWHNLGLEYGATVAAVGAHVKDLKPGDNVMGMGRRCLQRYMTMPAAALTKLPGNVSLEGAATIPSAFATAHYALNHVARLRKGERVLIHVATGGVGLAAVQLAKRAGAEIFATAGSEEKRRFLRGLGIRHVMSSRNLDFAAEIMRVTDGAGVDVILNSLPNAYIKKGLDILAPYGRFVEIGKRDVYADNAIGLKALRKNIQLAVLDLAALGLERPALMAELLSELNAMFAAGEIEALPVTSFPVSRPAEAFRYMSQAKHIGKVVVSFEEPSVDVRVSMDKAFRLDADASYLVTGGSRGFGLAVADWLSRCGAGRIILSSRSGKADDAEQGTMAKIMDRGTCVENIKLDVNDARSVSDAIRSLASGSKPLRGIVHGAAVIEDALLPQLDDDLVRRVLMPKIAGAWNLHRALADAGTHLDFFVSFSSTSQLLGSRGQANYVAANAFLDAFAHYRRARGEAAFTADWGPLGGSGVVARNDQLASYMASMGLHLVADHDATRALETFLRADRASLAYTAIDWSKFRRANARIEQNPRLAPLVADTGGRKARVRAELAAMPREDWPAQICTFLRGEVAKVLKIGAADVPTGRPLSEAGLDSLSSFEFKFGVEEELGLEISVSKFLQAPTLEKLTAVIIDIMVADAARAAEAGASAGAAREAHQGQAGFVASDRQRALVAIERGRFTSPEARAALRHRVEATVRTIVLEDDARSALAELVKRHPMMRLRLEHSASAEGVVLVLGDAPQLASGVAAGLDIAAGELVRVSLTDMDGATRIVIDVHAACMDRESVALLASEFLMLLRGEALPEPASEQDVLAVLAARSFDAERKACVADRAFWSEALTPWTAELKFGARRRVPAQPGCGRNQGVPARRRMSIDLAALLDLPAAARESLLLTAYGLALADVSGSDSLMVSRHVPRADVPAGAAGPFDAAMIVPLRDLDRSAAAKVLASVRAHLKGAEAHAAIDALAIEQILRSEMLAAGALAAQASFAYGRGRLAAQAGALHDVAIVISDEGARGLIELTYDTDAVSEEAAQHICRAFATRVAELSGPRPPSGVRVRKDAAGVAPVARSRVPAVQADPALWTAVPAAIGSVQVKAQEGAASAECPAHAKSMLSAAADYPAGRFEANVLDLIADPCATAEFQKSWTIVQALRIGTQVDVRRLDKAFAQIVERHETLRARFAYRSSGWRKIIDAKHRTGVTVRDLGEPGDAGIREAIDTAAAEPFDVEQGPLFKLDLLRCGSRGDVLLIRAHHLITDGYSQILICDELMRVSFGLPLPAAAPMTYGEYLERFEKPVSVQAAASSDAYWRRTILPALPRPNLGRVAKGLAPNLDGTLLGPVQKLDATIDQSAVDRIEAVARVNGCSLSNLVGAAFATVLARRGGVDGIYFNTPVASRVHPSLQSFAGFVCDFLPVRCDVSEAGSLEGLAAAIARQLNESYQHAPSGATKCDAAFDHLVNDAGGHLRQFECGMLIPEAAAKRSLLAPLLDKAGNGKMMIGRVEIEWLEAAAVRSTSSELDLRTLQGGDGLHLVLAFDTLAFEPAEARAILADITALLTQSGAAAEAVSKYLPSREAA